MKTALRMFTVGLFSCLLAVPLMGLAAEPSKEPELQSVKLYGKLKKTYEKKTEKTKSGKIRTRKITRFYIVDRNKKATILRFSLGKDVKLPDCPGMEGKIVKISGSGLYYVKGKRRYVKLMKIKMFEEAKKKPVKKETEEDRESIQDLLD